MLSYLSIWTDSIGELGVWLNLSWRRGNPCQTSSSVLSAIKTSESVVYCNVAMNVYEYKHFMFPRIEEGDLHVVLLVEIRNTRRKGIMGVLKYQCQMPAFKIVWYLNFVTCK